MPATTYLDNTGVTSGVSEVSVFQRSRTNPTLSDEALLVFQWIILTCVCQSIVVFGIVTNIINIICFLMQGFVDPVNVSLLGLAVSDSCCLITIIWTNICFTPAFSSLDLPFDSKEVQYLISGTPHVAFTHVTAWITALVTLERCLCITAPLKVKSIVTSKRVAVIIICVFVILLGSVAPVYMVNRLGMKFYLERNKTIIGLLFSEDRENVDKISYAVNNVAVPFLAFIVIIICTTILAVNLYRNTKWRKISSTAGQADNASNRNMKVAKMVVMISMLFIVCFILVSCTYVAMIIEPEISINGAYKNTCIVLGALGFVLESINSSTNIFIYYYMSSKYRITFRRLFPGIHICATHSTADRKPSCTPPHGNIQ